MHQPSIHIHMYIYVQASNELHDYIHKLTNETVSEKTWHIPKYRNYIVHVILVSNFSIPSV